MTMKIKLEKVRKHKITRYKCGEWIVDIVENDILEEYEAWLNHQDYGCFDLVFGMPYWQQSKAEFIDLVEANLHGYMDLYVEKHFTEEEW